MINFTGALAGLTGREIMALYKLIFLRRAFAVVAGVAALPVMLFW
jgi:hypothetical protein